MSESVCNIAVVYGSFQKGDCERDAKTIHQKFPPLLQLTGYDVYDPIDGNEFDFDLMKDIKVLVVCTSSKLGLPPPNFLVFAQHLLKAARTNPGCLSHMRHAVCGNGQEMYEDTYMNMPRYMDLLLEQCGSRRFFARGEFGEPNAALNTDKCECADWAWAMWLALTDTIVADADQVSWPLAGWDALWAQKPSPVHQNVKEWDEKALEAAFKKAQLTLAPPSVLAKM
jgi:sulfite reductase alpha subunit-like flavoprotein